MSDTIVAGVISAVVAITVGYFTARQSRRGQEVSAQAAAEAAVKNQTLSSRTQIEEQAFTRAAAIYNETIDRQQSEHEDDQREIGELKGRVRDLESEVEALKRGREADRQEIGRLKDRLSIATRLLGEKYPDE